MKVLMAVHGFPPEYRGGTELYVEALSRALVETGNDVEVAAGTGLSRDEAGIVPRDCRGLLVHEIHRRRPFVDAWDFSFDADVGGLVRELLLARRPDVLHVHHWIRLTRHLVEIAADLGIPAVCTVHDLYATCPRIVRVRDETFCESPLSSANCSECVPRRDDITVADAGLEIGLFRDDLRSELSLARAIVAPSRVHADLVARLAEIPRRRITVLPHGRITPAIRSSEPGPARPGEPLRIGHWGHLQDVKGVHLLLEAVAGLPRPGDVEVHLFGEAFDPIYGERLARLGRGLRVVWHGAFEWTELGRVPLHLAVIPSHCSESWSFVLDEAFVLGLPAVVPRRGALAERLDGAGFLFEPESSADLGARLAGILDDPSSLDRARARIPVLPSMDAHAAALAGIYAKAMRSRPRRPVAGLTARAERRLAVADQRREVLRRNLTDRLLAEAATAMRLRDEVAALTAARETQEAEMARLLASCQAWESENASLRREVEGADLRIRADLAAATAAAAARDADVAGLVADARRREAEMASLLESCREWEATVKRLQDEGSRAAASSAASKALAERHEAAAKALEERVHALAGVVQTRGEDLDRLGRESAALAENLAAERAAAAALHDRLQAATTLARVREGALRDLGAAVRLLRQEIAGLRADRNDLDDRLRRDADRSADLARRAEAALEAAGTASRRAAAEHAARVREREEHAAALRRLIDRTEAAAPGVSERIAAAEAERDALRARISDREASLGAVARALGENGDAGTNAGALLRRIRQLRGPAAAPEREAGRRRILMVVHQFLPRHVAGTEIYTWRVAKELRRRNDVVILYAEMRHDRPKYSAVRGSFDGIPVIEMAHDDGFPTFGHTYRSPEAEHLFEEVLDVERPDIVHIQHLHFFSLGLPAIAAGRGLPVVYTLHEFLLLCPRGGQMLREDLELCEAVVPSRCAGCIGNRPLRLPGDLSGPADHEAAIRDRLAAVRAMVPHVDLFISPSAFLRDVFVREGVIPPGRIVHSENGLDTAGFGQPRRPRTGRVVIGFIGSVAGYKGPQILIEAVRRLRGTFECRVHGDPDMFPSFGRKLRAAAAGTGIRFMGRYENRDVGAILAGIDVLVVPSLWHENSPVTIQEARAAGVPVVATRQGGMAEHVEDGRTGFLFRRGDPEDLARVLQRILDDPSVLDALDPRGDPLKSIAENAVELETIYGRLIAARRSGTAAGEGAVS